MVGLDETIYITTIIGQIAALGILLTFYQFVDTQHDDEYLGVKISSVYYGNIFLERIISSRAFFLLFIVEILCYPANQILKFFRLPDCEGCIKRYFYCATVCFFVLVFTLFWKSAVLIIKRKSIPEEQLRRDIIRKINKRYMILTKCERFFRPNCDVMRKGINIILNSKKTNRNDIEYYYDFIDDIVYESIRGGFWEKHLSNLNRRSVFVINEDSIIRALEKTLDSKEVFDERLAIRIFVVFMDVIDSFFREKSAQGYNRIDYYGYFYGLGEESEKRISVKNIDEFVRKLYKLVSLKDLERMILAYDRMRRGSSNDLAKEFSNDQILFLMKDTLSSVFAGERDAKEFNALFKSISYYGAYNDALTYFIADQLECYSEYDDENIVELVNDKNSEFLLSFLVLYFSVYKFRFEWKTICIKILKKLWNKCNENSNNIDIVSQMVRNTNARHRISEETILNFFKYISQDNSPSVLKDIQRTYDLDLFYMFIIKTCVLEQPLYYYYDKLDINVVIDLVNGFAKHAEVIKESRIQELISYFQYEYFRTMKEYPNNLERSLRVLILTNIHISEKILTEIKYTFYLGEYLLIHYREYSDMAEADAYIVRAFESHDMSIEQYIEWLHGECLACGFNLSNAQRLTMHVHLEEVLSRSD